MLGPHAQDQRRRGLGVQRRDATPGRQRTGAPPAGRQVRKFMDGLPMNCGDEHTARTVVDLERRARPAATSPWLITAITSAIAMASIWSWVT